MPETERLDSAHENEESKNPILRMLSDLMSNKHRGYAGLRGGGGVHPVQSIGVETGGDGGQYFGPEYTTDDIITALRDGVFGNTEHILSVRPNGPMNGYVLPGHIFQAGQHAFEPFVAGSGVTPYRVVNAHPMRLDVLLKAVTVPSGAIFIGSSENACSPTSGYPMTQGEVITLPVRSEIWACSTSTTQATLALISTMRDG